MKLSEQLERRISIKIFELVTRSVTLFCVTRFCNSRIPNLIFVIRSLKSKKKKLALTSFYCVSREIWLGNSEKLICIDQLKFYIFSHPREFQLQNILTWKYFSFFNNKPPATRVAHITRDLLTYYSCSYYSSMVSHKM